MPRIRTIKPEFWTSDQVSQCSPIARLLFIGMWNFCDDGGVHPASLNRLKMEIFPSDDVSLRHLADCILQLVRVGLLRFMEHETGKYFVVTGWHHQKIRSPYYRHPKPSSMADIETPNDVDGMLNAVTLPHHYRNVTVTDPAGSGSSDSSDIGSLDNTPPTPPKGGRPGKSKALPEDLPAVLEPIRDRIAAWLDYHRPYKPRGLSTLLTQLEKRATEHGAEAVADAMDRAMSNGWTGWDQGRWSSGRNGVPDPPREPCQRCGDAGYLTSKTHGKIACDCVRGRKWHAINDQYPTMAEVKSR